MPILGKDGTFYSIKEDKIRNGIIMENEQNKEAVLGEKSLEDLIFKKEKSDRAVIRIDDLGLMPEWVKETCPTDWNLYNLFEKYLPFAGHIGLMIATVWESMFLKGEMGRDLRPTSMIIVGEGAGGKTYCSSQFKRLPNLEDMEYPTFSAFIKKYGDTFKGSKKSMSLNNKFLYFTEMAMIARTSEQTRKNFFSCLNSLLTEGKFEGALKGTIYYLGERLKPIRMGLIGVMVMDDFYERVFPIADFATRILIIFQLFLMQEALVIDDGILYEAFGDHIDISERVEKIVPHYEERINVKYDPYNLNMEGVKAIIGRIAQSRKESYGFRASADAVRLLKAHALLNGRDKVMDEDVKMLRALAVTFKNICSNSCNFQIMLKSQENDIASVLESMQTCRVFKFKNEHKLYNKDIINKCYQDLLIENYFGGDKARITREEVKKTKEETGTKNPILNFFKDTSKEEK